MPADEPRDRDAPNRSDRAKPDAEPRPPAYLDGLEEIGAEVVTEVLFASLAALAGWLTWGLFHRLFGG